jgi:Protein of unknown function (DUF3558)
MIARPGLIALTAVLCTACSSTVAGTAAPSAAGPELPPRPRELRIDGFDPCGGLTSDQQTSLGVRFFSTYAPNGKLGPSCDWNHSPTEPVESYTIDINTHGGVELAFGQPQLSIVKVAGFGAVETPSLYSSGNHDCIVNVDVAAGQAVQVSYFYNGSIVTMTHEIACQKARNAAELAMQTILAKLGS